MGFKNGFWVWSGREEWIRYGFTQRKKSRGCVCDGGSVRESSEAEKGSVIYQTNIYIYIFFYNLATVSTVA